MKRAGYAFVSALRNEGVKLKVVELADGYGGDLQQAGPGAEKTAQGIYYLLGFEPIELHTAGTEQFASALKSIGIRTDPTDAEYNGYISVIMLVQALKAAGSSPTSASVLKALQNIHAFNAGGLLGSEELDPNNRTGYVDGVGNCEWAARYVGSTFHLVPGVEPLCGSTIPGKTVPS
jgi:branched-chain amino acid transport system substrate-binding protein